MKKFVIIVAGGSGIRMGSQVPKQFLPLCGKPVLMRTIECFYNFNPSIEIILVLPEAHVEYWRRLCDEYSFGIEHQIALGGSTRFHSVLSGLQLVSEPALVAVHDGVRPLVSPETLDRCFLEAAVYGSAIPVTDSVESVRIIADNGTGASRAVDRSTIKLVQTPQVFKAALIRKAYATEYRSLFTDDASVAEAAGYVMHLTQGNRENIKLTSPSDMLYAEAIIRASENNI